MLTTAPKPAAEQASGKPPEPQLAPGDVVLYGFKNPIAGGVVERPAMVIRTFNDLAQLAVMVDGPLDLVLLNAQERDPVSPRACVWRTAVEKAPGVPEAGKWRWRPH